MSPYAPARQTRYGRAFGFARSFAILQRMPMPRNQLAWSRLRYRHKSTGDIRMSADLLRMILSPHEKECMQLLEQAYICYGSSPDQW